MAGEDKPRTEHLEAVVSHPSVDDTDVVDEKVVVSTERTAGEAIVAQQTAIPLTGERIPTSKLEYIVFAIFCAYHPTPFPRSSSYLDLKRGFLLHGPPNGRL